MNVARLNRLRKNLMDAVEWDRHWLICDDNLIHGDAYKFAVEPKPIKVISMCRKERSNARERRHELR